MCLTLFNLLNWELKMKIFRSNDYLSAMIYENPYYDKHNNRYHDDLNKNEVILFMPNLITLEA